MGRIAERATDGAGVLDGLLAGLDPGWRIEDPAAGAQIGRGVRVFHDGDRTNMALCRGADALVLTIYQFRGTYLSVAVDVPRTLQARLRPGWRLMARLMAEATRPTTAFLRLNLGHRQGNTNLHEVVVIDTGSRGATFDLDAAGGDWSSSWLDIIFSHPRMTEIRLSGLFLSFEES